MRRLLAQVIVATMVLSLLGAPVSASAGVAADGTVIGGVAMGANTRLSAGVYDARGQLVRHLYEMALRSGTVALRWDGRDDAGNEMPSGSYNWRAVTTRAAGTDDGSVGNRGKPVAGLAYERTAEPHNPTGVAYGPEGDVYVVSNYEETQNDVFRFSPANLSTGQRTWGSQDAWDLEGTAVAADSQYVYVAAHLGRTATGWKQYGVYRLDAQTGKEAAWPGAGRISIIPDWHLGIAPVTSLAVDGTYLWVVNPAADRIEVFTKADGLPAPILGGTNTMSLASPRGIVTDGANQFWITTGDHAERFVYDPALGQLRSEARTPALDRPYGVAWYRSGATSTLYVSEIGAGHVRKYDVAGAVPVARAVWFSAMPAGGKVTDTSFGWPYENVSWVPGGDAAIAVSPDGRTLSAVDIWNGRTLFFDTARGTPLPDRLEGITLQVTPDVDPNLRSPDLISLGRQYAVDYGKTDSAYGHPWRVTHNWWPADNADSAIVPFGASMRHLNGNDYLYVYVTPRCPWPSCGDLPPGLFPWGGVLIYQLNTDEPGRGMKRIAAIRSDTPSGPPRLPDEATSPHVEIITDTNGDGVLGDTGDTTEASNWKGFIVSNPGIWVDAQGTIWFALAGTLDQAPGSFTTAGVAALPVHAYDRRHRPTYSLADFTVRVPHGGDPATGAAAPTASQVKYDAVNQRLFMVAESGEFDPGSNGGGDAVQMVDFRTGLRSVFSGYSRFAGPRYVWRDTITAMAVDTAGGYLYTGGNSGVGQRITMYTWDGLAVARAKSQLPTFAPGYFDESMSLTAFTAPNGVHYVYGEDNFYGRNSRFAFTGVGTTARSGSDPSTGNTSGAFIWSAPSTADGLVAWWRFDFGRHSAGPRQYVADSTGNDHFGVVEATGATNEWWQPEGGVHNGAIAFDGTSVTGVHFRKNTWLNTPDNLIDNPGYGSALTFATWIKTTDSGVVIGYQNSTTVEWYPPPTASAPLVYVGQDGRVRGGAHTDPGCANPQVASAGVVNDGQWHHVALAVAPSGQTLYVDGSPADTTDCAAVTADLGFTSLSNGYTTGSSGPLPSTPGGYFHYAGSLDDTRLYGRTLSADEIQALATIPAQQPPLAHWTFDETTGTTAADVTDHGNDVTVSNGIWQPTGGHLGGALSFDGTTTVALPDDFAELAPLTFATWFKTTSGGVILGDQRGAYPADRVAGWIGEGVGPLSAHELEIATDGTVRTLFMNQIQGGPGKSPDLRDGQWHHVAVTSTNTGGAAPQFTVTLYLDGRPIDTGTTPQGIWSDVRPNSQLGVGRDNTGPWVYYQGLIDDLRIYPRALTATEVLALAAM